MADPKQEIVEETVQGNNLANEQSSSDNALESSTCPNDELAEADAVTPLASEQESLSGGASEPWEDPTDESFPIVPNTEVPKTATTTTAITPGKSPIAATTPTAALPSTQVSHEHASHSYFPIHSLHSQPPSKRGLRLPNGSGQSSGSLHTLAETEGPEEGSGLTSVKRSNSTRTRSSSGYIRKHHSKSLSMSHPIANLVKSHVNSAQPVYPEQSLASLSPQPPQVQSPNPVRPVPLRAKSSHPADTLSPHSPSGNKMNVPRFAHTADNTPMGSPGLFTPMTTRTSNPLESTQPRSGSPSLHHLQTPKETHAAEIDVDTISGNKLINTYEVIKELGRGEHGKVKLGRDMETGVYVGIKIVPRWSKHRRLGRLGAPQDQTKREVAILKKARHPNVVSLLEVIDDPNKNKVYLVLEYVELGEIQWRKLAVYPIAQINNQRFESERKGISLTIEPSEQDEHLVKMAQLRHEGLERNRQNLPHSTSTPHYALAYEPHGEDGELLYQTISQAQSIANSSTASDGPRHGPSRVPSTDDYATSHPLNGTMYGPYDDSANRSIDGERMFGRKQSLAALSHMSSEVEFAGGLDYEQSSYVPALTFQEARNAFRDTLLGLEFLHAIGIIHRDIKPSNLLVSSDGTVKISDFGVSYFGQPITEEEAESRNKVQEFDAKPLDDERELARSVGTPGFWAPELCYDDPGIFADGKIPKITGAIDMWALGTTLYAMIYARLPFQATNDMGLHEAACTAEPVFPKTRLTPVDTTHGDEATDCSQSINSNKRCDYDLKFEHVPENLRDLMSKLLVKDPAYRITISEAKRHPWVLEGMKDTAQFLKLPEVLEKGSKKKILEVNEKEMSVAVTKRSFVEKMTLATTRIVNNMMKGMTTGRKRATSTSTNTGASNSSESVNTPSGSVASTVGKTERGRDGRRESLHNFDVVSALQRSRDGTKEEHPLAQSQTASPDNQSLAISYFDTPKPMPSPGGSPRIHPQPDARPKLPDRAISGVSTAESVKTIRASQVNPHFPLEATKERDSRLGSEPSLKAKVEGLWEGTAKTFSRLASRDRRSPYASRSPSVSRRSSESEHRGVPSLAISNTQATGSIAAPDVLRAVNQRLEQTSPMSSGPSSPTTTAETYRPAPTSTASAFLEAQEINQRRYILEAQQSAEEAALASQAEHMTNEGECPPSPDDLTFRRQRSRSMEHPSHPPLDIDMPSRPSISTTVSSLEDIANSSVAQSGSNYSFNATSGASSPPEDTFLSAEYKEHYARDLRNDGEPEFMRTADTVTEHGRPRASTTSKLESSTDYYDNDGDDEDDSSGDEDGMMMGGPKKVFR